MPKTIKNKHLVKVSIKDGLITITFGTDYLKHTVENNTDLEGLNTTTGNMVPAEVTDLNKFTKEFVKALEEEGEDGTTLVHRMIDLATQNAIETGCEGVEVYDEP